MGWRLALVMGVAWLGVSGAWGVLMCRAVVLQRDGWTEEVEVTVGGQVRGGGAGVDGRGVVWWGGW